MIRFEQVGKRYPNGHIGLHELSFQVRRGEFLFVTGHSGAGKSTLLRLLLAMERPTSGKLLLAGPDLSRITKAQIPFLRRTYRTQGRRVEKEGGWTVRYRWPP